MEENGSDMLTKVLSTEKLHVCQRRIEMASHPMPSERGVCWETGPFGGEPTNREKETGPDGSGRNPTEWMRTGNMDIFVNMFLCVY